MKLVAMKLVAMKLVAMKLQLHYTWLVKCYCAI